MEEMSTHKEPKGKNPLIDLLTVPEAAAEKGVSASAVSTAIQKQRLAAWLKKPIYLIPRKELEKWQPVVGRGRRTEKKC